jgi:2-dehydro-3-deoxyphosphogluconate aldolase/(4S)-4-hydroxy-2-oxoglutarate aldolase
MRAKEAFSRENIIAVVRAQSLDEGKRQVSSLDAANVEIVEISLNNEFAEDLIKWSLEHFPKICLGAATILTLEQAKKVYDWGVNFMASPVAFKEVLDFAKESKFFFIPGAHSPTEIAAIQQNYSFPLIKLFPTPSIAAFQGIQKVFTNTKFVLSSFPVNEIKGYIDSGAGHFAIGSYLMDDLDNLKQKVISLKELLPSQKALYPS